MLIDRLEQELNEVTLRVHRLRKFLNTPGYSDLGPDITEKQYKLIIKQLKGMDIYSEALNSRINDLRRG